MTVQDENGVYRSLARERRNQRRKQLGVGLAGLAAIAGAGAFAVQSELIDLAPPADEPPLVIAQPPPSPPPSAKASTSASRARGLAPATPWRVVRSGVRQRTSPTPSPPPPPSVAAAAAPITELTETTASGAIRVTTAGFDLTGRAELTVAGDRGWPVDKARCTRNIRSTPAGDPRVVPSMLVCWRTSAQRSVVTIAVAERGRPSSAESVAVLEREWARLG